MRTIFAGYNPQSTAGWKFRLQDLPVDYDTRQIFVGKKEIDLTQTENNITHSPVPPSLLGSYASSSTVPGSFTRNIQTECWRSSCIIMHRPGMEISQVSFSKASTGTLWWMGTLGITK